MRLLQSTFKALTTFYRRTPQSSEPLAGQRPRSSRCLCRTDGGEEQAAAGEAGARGAEAPADHEESGDASGGGGRTGPEDSGAHQGINARCHALTRVSTCCSFCPVVASFSIPHASKRYRRPPFDFAAAAFPFVRPPRLSNTALIGAPFFFSFSPALCPVCAAVHL